MQFNWPNISDDTERAVVRQLRDSVSIYNRSGVFEEFENELAAYHGTKRCLLTSSGTAALHSVYFGLDLGPGDEVICPTYTFFATVTPLLHTGATPVLADCDAFGNICVRDVERKITPRTRALMITHMWGRPCDMRELVDLAERHQIALLEDGSHAHGASYEGQPVGSFGAAAAFSLQGQKTLTGGEGGFVLTNDDEIYYRALVLGHYNKRCKQEIPADHALARFATTGAGLKLRAHPLAIAMANEQFGKLEQILNGRREVAAYIAEALRDHPVLEPLLPGPDRASSWYAMLFRLREHVQAPGGALKRIVAHLRHRGCADADIPNSTCPLNLLPLFQDPGALFPRYRGVFGYREGEFPNAERFYRSVFKIPVWHDLAAYRSEVDLYVNSIRTAATEV